MLAIIVPETEYIDYILKEVSFEIVNDKYKIYQCEYGNHDFLILITGYGKVNISLALEYLTQCYDINSLIELGIAGYISNKNNILDIIIPSEVIQIDVDFTCLGYDLLTLPNEIKRSFQTDIELNKSIIKSLKHTDFIYHDCFIGSADSIITHKNKIMSQLNIRAVDNHSGVIGMITYKKKIPYTSIKIISYELNNYAINQYLFYKESAILKAQKVLLNYLKEKN